ncbi:N-acetylglucosaminidase [Clostridium sp. JNZ J1-5]
MRKKLNLIKILLMAALFTLTSTIAFAATTGFTELPSKTGVSTTKPWTVKLNLDLDKNTINSENIKVKDNKGNAVKATVYPGKDNKSIMVYPQVGGYFPATTYSLELSTNVKSTSGKNLAKPTKMSFTTSNQYEDTTYYEALPSIKTIDILEGPILENKSASFRINPNYSGEVQYRVFLFKYPKETYDNPNVYPNEPYIELTKGYTSALSGNSPYIFKKSEGFASGKYKLVVYIKAKGRAGESKDLNTDFDNYYSSYFRVIANNITVDKPAGASIIYSNYDKTLEEAALEQLKGNPTYQEVNGKWLTPSKELVKYYMNPNNFLDNYGKYQFLNLNYIDGITEDNLNSILEGKGVLDGKGAVFLKASKDANINPIYLVAHALHETGNGTSQLASGVLVSSVDGKAVEPKKTYNMFGIRAIDSNPLKYGSEYAYTQGWFSVDAAILGGAKFVSEGYINSAKYMQNTLYKMRWNMQVTWHQYATDVNWSRAQISRIESLMNQCEGAQVVFDVPKFK